ncbi:MAG: peroxide stress protein YaaA, partial [Betaproteobacteria bacterium]|nr:peroxide stress protein YaaA [Betaproteobacteria bacterium]
ARGLMTRFALLNRLVEPEGLKAFAEEGYAFAAEASDATTWVFRRRQA